MTEIILHAIEISTGKDKATAKDPFTGCITTSLQLDKKSYTVDTNGKAVFGILVRQRFINNIDRFRQDAINNTHTLKDLQKGEMQGWCKACFNRVARAVGKADKII